jgi:hypothetical protein
MEFVLLAVQPARAWTQEETPMPITPEALSYPLDALERIVRHAARGRTTERRLSERRAGEFSMEARHA